VCKLTILSNRKLWAFLFYIYIILVTAFVVIKVYSLRDMFSTIQIISMNRESGYWNINLVPFRTLNRYIPNIYEKYVYLSILGKTVAFIPLGFLIPMAFPVFRNFLKATVLIFTVIIGKEIFKLFSMLGYFDIDTIILNIVSSIFGYLLYYILYRFLDISSYKQ